MGNQIKLITIMPPKTSGFGNANPAFKGGGGGGKKMSKGDNNFQMEGDDSDGDGKRCINPRCMCTMWISLLILTWLGCGILGLYIQFSLPEPDYLLSIAIILIMVALFLITGFFCATRRGDDEDDGRYMPSRVAAWSGYFLLVAAAVLITLKVVYREAAYTGPEQCRRKSGGKGFYRFVDSTCYTQSCPDGECGVFQHGFSGCASNCYTTGTKVQNLTANKGIIQHFDSSSNLNPAARQFNFTPPVGYTVENTGFKASASILTRNVSSAYTGTLSYAPCAEGSNCSTLFNTQWLDSKGASVSYLRTCGTAGTLLSSSSAETGEVTLEADSLLNEQEEMVSSLLLSSRAPSLLASNRTCDGPAKVGPWRFSLSFDPPIKDGDVVHVFIKLISNDPSLPVDVSEVVLATNGYQQLS